MEAPLAPREESNQSFEAALAECSDEELMERVQRDDAGAYRALFERHHRRIYGFLVRRTGDPQAAAELYQETFLRVHRARDTWQVGRPFRPWLYGIATNAARDAQRRRRRRPEEVELDDQRFQTLPHYDARVHLEAAIARLPDTLREAFLLGVVEGFDHNEIALQLGISAANARARVSRARAHLRSVLEDSTP